MLKLEFSQRADHLSASLIQRLLHVGALPYVWVHFSQMMAMYAM